MRVKFRDPCGARAARAGGKRHRGRLAGTARGRARHGRLCASAREPDRCRSAPQGGNAVDAAIATAYALAVTFPEAGNLGGGGFMLIRMADGRETFIDFRETAPAAATRTMFLDASGMPVPLLSTRGYLSAGIPGTVAGLELARKAYGTRPRAKLVGPAIELAARGFVLEQGDAEFLAREKGIFERTPRPAQSFSRTAGPMSLASGWFRRTWRACCASSQGRSRRVLSRRASPPDCRSQQERGGHLFLGRL